MTDWLFDLGNTRLKFAPLRGGDVGEMSAIAHDGHAFEPGWTDRLPQAIGSADIASVASPALRAALGSALDERAARVRFAETMAQLDGVTVAYPRPGDLGVDRFLSLLAAHALGGAWLVVGVGTALTVDLVDAQGRHQGGRIAPSPALMREALHARARQLPAEGGHYREFADDTSDALASGCLGAAIGLVERSLREADALSGCVPGLVLHGGGAAALSPHLPPSRVEPLLVLQGLARWARAQDG